MIPCTCEPAVPQPLPCSLTDPHVLVLTACVGARGAREGVMGLYKIPQPVPGATIRLQKLSFPVVKPL